MRLHLQPQARGKPELRVCPDPGWALLVGCKICKLVALRHIHWCLPRSVGAAYHLSNATQHALPSNDMFQYGPGGDGGQVGGGGAHTLPVQSVLFGGDGGFMQRTGDSDLQDVQQRVVRV
jgi:hypothetical protein